MQSVLVTGLTVKVPTMATKGTISSTSIAYIHMYLDFLPTYMYVKQFPFLVKNSAFM
jgi:hypothetical protein